MNYIEAVLVKYAMIFSVIFVIYGLTYGIYISTIYWLAALISLITLATDWIVFKNSSNLITTLLDFPILIITIWLSTLWLIGERDFSLIGIATLTALVLSLLEWFYHLYLKKRVLQN